MAPMTRRDFAKLSLSAASLSTLALTGCVSRGGPASDTGQFSVVCVYNGPLGDQSFFDDAERGMQMMKADDFKTLSVQGEINNPVQWKANLETVSTGRWDVVITGTSQMKENLEEISVKYPEQKFVFYDDEVKSPNVVSIIYRQNEGSFLAGVLAGLVTTNKDKFPLATGSKIVGMVGGMDMPVINDFLVGFKKGCESVDKDIQVKVAYVGNFTDSQKGSDQADLLYGQGADVIFQVAGGAGFGVLKSAANRKRYAIGVDSNQNGLQPGFILASMLKNIGISLAASLTEARAGKLVYGQTAFFGLANNGVKLDFADNGDVVPKDIQDKIMEYGQQVIDGKIAVPTAFG